MMRPKKSAAREEEARMALLEIGRPPEELLSAIADATSLDLNELGTLVRRSGYTVRRWRGEDEPDIPAAAVCAVEDLRSIIAMLIEAGHSRRSITSFLRSRNVGLGRDRPLDGLRSDIGEFARVEHVTQCFLRGIAPEQGRHVIERPRVSLPVATNDADEPLPKSDPDEPVHPGGSKANAEQREKATA